MIISISSGCGEFIKAASTSVPAIDKPAPPAKPPIESQVMQINGEYYIVYKMTDGLALYKYLVSMDGYVDKLLFRIDQLNTLHQNK